MNDDKRLIDANLHTDQYVLCKVATETQERMQGDICHSTTVSQEREEERYMLDTITSVQLTRGSGRGLDGWLVTPDNEPPEKHASYGRYMYTWHMRELKTRFTKHSKPHPNHEASLL